MRRAVTLALAALLCCAACSATAAQTPPSSPSSPSSTAAATPARSVSRPTATPSSAMPAAPTVPADVPRTGPNTRRGETPPVMPVVAMQHTAAGAKAFAEFFIKTIDWGYATTSSTYMRHYFSKTCIECLNAATFLDNARRLGERYIGARITVLSTSNPRSSGSHGASTSTLTVLDITSFEVVDRRGNMKNAGPARVDYPETLNVAWRPSAWRVLWMVGK